MLVESNVPPYVALKHVPSINIIGLQYFHPFINVIATINTYRKEWSCSVCSSTNDHGFDVFKI